MTQQYENYITLPSDVSNTGKKIRTVTGTVSGYPVHTHHYASVSIQLITGLYYSSSSLYSVNASAQDGTSTAIWWFQVPSDATVNARIRKIDVSITNAVATAVDHATAPRLLFTRGTFTGTFAGATQNVVKRKTSDSNNQADLRTAVTGATVSLGSDMWTALIPGVDITTASLWNLYRFLSLDFLNEDEFIDLAPGECLVCYQADNGTTSDQRRLMVNFGWDEYDNT